MPENTVAFFEFSLGLSRACLGKKIAFRYKWLKTVVLAYSISIFPLLRSNTWMPIAAGFTSTSLESSSAAIPFPLPSVRTRCG